ncbi:MAG: hypothetical protein ACLU4N_16430 [Butyricimonas faecihominis]
MIIAFNERAVDLHAEIEVKIDNVDKDGQPIRHMIKTTVGRVILNQFTPKNYPYINTLITKKALRDIIGDVFKRCGVDVTAKFLDDIKDLGYRKAFEGGLSFNLGDVIVPENKQDLLQEGYDQVEEVMANYNMGFITNNERYNQIIDIWTHVNANLTATLMKQLAADDQGFNSIYMMLDSGARGSREQIRQLGGMRGLMAKPQKSGATGGQIIENPILANFKEGLSVLEYFISTHGARKGWPYRVEDCRCRIFDSSLVDVANDITITEEDCGTLRGITISAIKNNEEIVSSLSERILGRVSVHDIYHPNTGELIVASGDEITEVVADIIENSPIERVEVRSVLTCEAKKGVCAKCYGRNLATSRMVEKGEAVGVIAAQSIGEPGTQLTLRTFHVGGPAGNISSENSLKAKYDGYVEYEELRSVEYTQDNGTTCDVVVGRLTELRILDKNTNIILISHAIPYGAKLFVKDGQEISKVNCFGMGPVQCFDHYRILRYGWVGKLDRGETYKEESDETTGFREMIIIEFRDKMKAPALCINDAEGNTVKSYNLPVGAHIVVKEGAEVVAGSTIAKIPRAVGKAGDITGGLPRVTELFEARNPSNPAVVSEIDGEVTYGKIKRGNREIIVTSKAGEVKKYLVSLSKQILVQENDYVRAGTPLSDGAITPTDILNIEGPIKVQEYIVNEVQDVYRMQGVKINDKHFEIIVHQMMRKVLIQDAGDTRFLENQVVDKSEFMEENDAIYGKKVVLEAGDSDR